MKSLTDRLDKFKAGLIGSSEYVWVTLIILLALFIRLGILLNTVDFHGIANGKILEAQMILNDPANIKLWIPVHPPVHMLFLVIGIKLFGSIFAVSRIISLGFGLMTILFAYLYLKQVFNQQIALFSILGMSLYSVHIVYSIIGTSETSYHFFLFFSLYIYEQFKQNSNKYLLSLLGLSVGMASMCRYEGLLLIPFYLLILSKQKLNTLRFAVFALIIPLLWMLFNYLVFDNAFEFLASNNFIVPLQINWIRSQGFNIDYIYKLLFWPKVLIASLGNAVFVLGLGGIAYSVFKKINKPLTGLFILFFSVFVLNTLRETLYLQPRYAITLGLILIPFSICCAFKILEKISPKIPRWIVLILIWTMIIPIGGQVLASQLYVPDFAKNTALYLKDNADPLGNIMIDHCGDEKYREPIKVLSRINPMRFSFVPKKINQNNDFAIDLETFFQMIATENIKTLVYSQQGELGDSLNLNAENSPQHRQGFNFILKYKSHPYYIYQIEKVANEQ